MKIEKERRRRNKWKIGIKKEIETKIGRKNETV